jgi:uncharacterized repeat protein (TIGR03803 family)
LKNSTSRFGKDLETVFAHEDSITNQITLMNMHSRLVQLPLADAPPPASPVRQALNISVMVTLLLTCLPAAAQHIRFDTLYSFQGSGTGPRNPTGALAVGPDGNFYGTTYYGGTSNSGTIFRYGTNSVLTPLVSFNGANGAYPYPGLVQGNYGYLYGTTESGGAGGYGTVFQLTTAGSFSTLVNFYLTNGAFPYGRMCQGSDGYLYGTTASGGAEDSGTAFQMTYYGSLNEVLSFDGNNEFPSAGLVQGGDGNLYGTSYSGGAYGLGTVFKGNINYAPMILVSFNGTNGANPDADLILGQDGSYYGTTFAGGVYGLGTVFKITTNGLLTTLVSFNNANGAYPEGALVQATDGNFYGTTSGGGTGYGTVFQMTPAGALTTLVSFNGANGAVPYAGLTLGNDGNLYGTSEEGGSSAGGTIFRITIDPRLLFQPVSRTNLFGTTAFFSVGAQGTAPLSYRWRKNGTNLSDTATISGSATSSLTLSNVFFSDAGSYQVVVSNLSGSVTSAVAVLTVVPPPPFQLQTAAAFNSVGTGPINPQSALIVGPDGALYGTSYSGGASSYGTVFRYAADGTLSNLVSFKYTNGAYPSAPLTLGSDGNFYGTTTGGGSNGYGTVFKLLPNGTLNTLLTFNQTNGNNPDSRLVQGPDAKFYGTTLYGSTNGYGNVFRVSTNGILENLFSFSSTNGYNPNGVIFGANSNLYGSTQNGGPSGYGTLFRLTTNGILTTLYAFDYTTNGGYPYGSLALGSDGYFYGTANVGGSNGYGTVFRLSVTGTTNVTALTSFNYANGGYPAAGLIQASDGNFYGVTPNGGAGNYGNVFRVGTNGVLATLASFFYTNGAYPSAELLQVGDGSFYGTTSSGGALGGGTIYHLVPDPYLITQPLGQTNSVNATAAFSVTAQGTPPLSYQWQKGGTNLHDLGNVSGSGTATLALSNLALADAGNYRVVVTNAAGSVTSRVAVLTVTSVPGPALVTSTPGLELQLALPAVSGGSWRIEASPDLKSWSVLTNETATGGELQFADPEATNWVQRYFRAVWQP